MLRAMESGEPAAAVDRVVLINNDCELLSEDSAVAALTAFESAVDAFAVAVEINVD